MTTEIAFTNGQVTALPASLPEQHASAAPTQIPHGMTRVKSNHGWLCRANGQCDLLGELDISQVEVIRLSSSFRLFRLVQHQSGNKPDHVLTWGEAKHCAVLVWSTYVSKGIVGRTRSSSMTGRSINTALRDQVSESMQEACANPSARLQARGFLNLNKKSDTGVEVAWHILPRPRCNIKLKVHPSKKRTVKLWSARAKAARAARIPEASRTSRVPEAAQTPLVAH